MSVRENLADRMPGGDAGLIVAVLLVTYAAYVLVGVGLGYSLRGQLNTIAVLTFYIGVFAMLALALNLHWGYTGLFNIGIVGFMAIGIYVMALVSKPLYEAGGAAQVGGLGLPLIVGIVAGMAAAALLGLVVALPALRLRADYLAIVTIAMSEIIRFSLLSNDLQRFQLFGNRVGFGGGSGLILDFTDPLQAFFQAFGLWNAYLGVVDAFTVVVPNNPKPVVDGLVYGFVLLCFVAGYFWLLKRTGESPFGRVLKAIREDEDVANSLGKDTNQFKIKSFMLGCALMGLAGILWLMTQGAVTPNFFRPRITFFVWIALIIGGAGSNTGSVLGGAVFAAVLYQGPRYFKNLVDTVLPSTSAPSGFGPAIAPLISNLNPAPMFFYTIDSIRQLQLVIMGLVLIWLMHNRPEGMLGYRKETAAGIPLTAAHARRTAADGGEVDDAAPATDAATEGGDDDE
ncbi:branched-chain amino acid transport system permease protein [Halogeometricum rufum]|uniref:Branched-chain amino acid transport system permease protein n=1 Tax=Halogeometricum rufum TaxID=553469 RepID=A0A1I6HJP9_9EURY|nr:MULTISPECIES: branched-chain amino acid ABC transporter permease [Halogeometricum]MUV57870.1 branched-chain amino acid ABC transporter permease [Halogeometricum sp. CBA1124]SFR54540.1 branched-chain amino acid transport system permease protein [Halogeometricum rufum]